MTVHGTLEADSRAAYDLLVRPASSVSAAERQGNLVSSTAMSSIDGGITLKQWQEIEQIPGVYAAAPVAVVGYDYLQYDVAVQVPSPAPGQSQVLYRLAPTLTSEDGLTKVPAEEQYVYTTTSPLAAFSDLASPDIPQRDGSMLAICQAGDSPTSTSEIVPACGSTNPKDAWNTPSAANPHATGSGQLPTGTQDIAWFFPFLMEAIDPAQEAKLDGLGDAMTSGGYLSESAGPVTYSATKPDAQTRQVGGCASSFSDAAAGLPGAVSRCQWTSVPVLAADASPMQEALQVTEYRMPQSPAAIISSLPELENGNSFMQVDPADGVNKAAPISVIRVKLTGQLGLDAASQARLRLVAQEIYQRTGLHVDITEGSSPAPVTVIDPAGHYGRPKLQLTELWSRIGAAELISSAIDQKTRLLMLLVLVLGTVFTASAVAASVRTRRPELAVLACTGWPRRSLAGLILTECALLGVVAGAGGAGLAAGLAPLAGARLDVGTYVALGAVALVLTCLAGLYPALMAARAHPGTATAAVPGGRRYRRLRVGSLARLAVVNVARVPGRSLLAAAGVALAVAGLTLLTVLTLAFHGAAAGTLLGQAIIVQVHAAD
ncbi:MAG TPA: FtsX-like permease family protein, partial [Trebonia sp.]